MRLSFVGVLAGLLPVRRKDRSFFTSILKQALRFVYVALSSRSRTPAAASLLFFFECRRFIVKRLGHGVAFSIDAGQQFDLAFRLLQRFVALFETLDALLVFRQRLTESQLAVLEIGHDLLQFLKRLLESKFLFFRQVFLLPQSEVR